MFPLFGPVPGGMEIMVILLVAVFMFGIPIALAGGLLVAYRHVNSDDAETSELEALRHEVEYLREEVEQLEDDRQHVGRDESGERNRDSERDR
ncbi:hypothetical protein [Halorussus halophilus]|uniref:hypothetical protein n=1 Tax=Halorussus halophilus TaxID=2650975 RepID=UPI0017880590|nr:hypothetical protein [Halorussus halophilus]